MLCTAALLRGDVIASFFFVSLISFSLAAVWPMEISTRQRFLAAGLFFFVLGRFWPAIFH